MEHTTDALAFGNTNRIKPEEIVPDYIPWSIHFEYKQLLRLCPLVSTLSPHFMFGEKVPRRADVEWFFREHNKSYSAYGAAVGSSTRAADSIVGVHIQEMKL